MTTMVAYDHQLPGSGSSCLADVVAESFSNPGEYPKPADIMGMLVQRLYENNALSLDDISSILCIPSMHEV